MLWIPRFFRMESDVTAKLVMDPEPQLLRPEETIGDAAEKILQCHHRSIAVVDDNRRFLGLVTVSSLLYLVLPKAATMHKGVDSLSYMDVSLAELKARFMKHADEPVSVCMEAPKVVVHPDTPLLDALLALYRNRRNLPVVDRDTGVLEGMITYFDVGAHILGAEEESADGIRISE